MKSSINIFIKILLSLLLILFIVSENGWTVSTHNYESLLDVSVHLDENYKESILTTHTKNKDVVIIVLKNEMFNQLLVNEYSKNLFLDLYKVSDRYTIDINDISDNIYHTVASSSLYDYAYDYHLDKNELTIYETNRRINSIFILKIILILGILISFVFKKLTK